MLFDVDGTLYYQFPLRISMVACLVVLNFLSPRELMRKIRVINAYRSAQELLRCSVEKNTMNSSGQLAMTVEKTKESPDYVAGVISEWFEKKPLPFLRFFRRRGLLHLLAELKKQGILLGVFSDYPADEKLKALGVRHYFKTMVSSHDSQVNGFKPRTNGFLIAAVKMGLKPCEILYVGDRSDIDGKGAQSAGMSAVIVNQFSKNRKVTEFPVIQTIKGVMWHIYP